MLHMQRVIKSTSGVLVLTKGTFFKALVQNIINLLRKEVEKIKFLLVFVDRQSIWLIMDDEPGQPGMEAKI